MSSKNFMAYDDAVSVLTEYASDIKGKTDKVTSAINGDLASLDANGNLSDSGIASTNVVVKSATVGLIKNDGTIDTNTYLTEDDITDKADKVTSATNGDLAGLDTNGNLTDSGILASNVIVKSVTAGLVKNDGTIDTNTYLTDADIADKADIVENATDGDLAGLDANGNLTDSGVLASDILVKSSTVGLVKNDGTIDTNSYATTTQLADKTDKVANATNGNLAGLDSNGNLTDSGVVANNVIEKVATATGLLRDDGTVDTSTYATTTQLTGKADKVANATADDLATLDANGNLTDSGINKNIIPNTATSSNKLATNNDLPTELNDLSDDVTITSPTNGQILKYNATSGKWENQTEQPPISGATFKGSILFANIPITGMENGDWYDIKDAFTTDSRFEEGAGIECTAGTDIIWVADDSKWNILTPSGVNSFNGRVGAVVPASGDYDASDIDYDNTTSGLTATDVQDAIDEVNTNVNGKANKVSGAINGHLAGLDANGNLTDSGVLATSISGKADKVVSATDGDLAKLNSYGNLVDSGISADNVVVKSSTAGLIKNDGSIDTSTYATTAKAYLTDDTAETALDDTDYVPFYDTSATAKRKTLWSNIKSVLKTYFDTVYKDINVHDDWEDVTNKPFENIAIGSSGLEVDSGGWLSALIRTVQLRHYNGVRQGDGTGFTQLWVNSQAASGNSIIEGTQFFQQKVTLSTSNPVQVTFEETEITTDKVIEVFAGRYNGDVSGEQNIFPYSNMYTTNGTCVITYPAFTSAIQILVRIYVK